MAAPSSKVRLVTGRAGSGKTGRIVDLFLSRRGALSGRCVLLLVPDEGVAGALRERIAAAAPERGFVDRGIATFETWAARFLGVDETAAPEEESLLLLALEEDLPAAIAGRVRSPRFRGAFLRWIADLREEGIGASEVRAVHRILARGDRRLEHLAAALDRFDEKSRAWSLSPRASLPARAAAAIGRGAPVPAIELLLVDGFHHFSSPRLDLLAALAPRAGEAWVTLPAPEGDEDRWRGESFDRAFSALAERLNLDVERLPGGEDPLPPVLLGGADRREEIERIARRIRSGLAGGGRMPSDFLVLFRDAEPYHAAISGIFPRYGVPYRGRFQVGAPSTAPGRALLDCIRLGREGVTRAAADAIWKNRTFAVEPDRADRVVRRWKGTPEPSPGEEVLREVAADGPGFAAEWAQPLLRFAGEIARSTGAETIRLLRDTWLEWIEPSLAEEAYPAGDLPRIGASVARLSDLLVRAARIAGAERSLARLPPNDLLRLVGEEVRRARIAFVEGNAGGVRIDDFRHGQNLRAPVLFLAGLDAGLSPRGFDPGSFWNEEVREQIGESGQFRVRDRRAHAAEERYLFRRAYERGTEEVYLSASAFDPDGGSLAESPFRIEMRGEFPGGPAGDLGPVERYGTAGDVVSRHDILPFLSSRADPAAADPEGVALAARLLAESALPLPAPPRSHREAVRIGSAPPFRAWIAARREFSVTELEDYRACPYRYLARHVLRIDEPAAEPALGFGLLAEGLVLHRVLEEALRGGEQVEEGVDRLLREERRPFPERIGHRLVAERLRERLRRLLDEDRAFRDGFQTEPESFEFRFGEREGSSLDVGEGVRIRGRIDRIDACGAEELLVIDYKRKAAMSKGELIRAIEEGLSLALPLYAAAAASATGRRPAGAFLLGVLENKRIGFYDAGGSLGDKSGSRGALRGALALSPERFGGLLATAKRIARETVAAIRSGAFPVRPAGEKTCDRLRCPYRDLCRIVLATRRGGER